MRYIIKDWAGNILNFRGKIERPEFAVPMEFDTDEDAFTYLQENYSEEEQGELVVLPNKKNINE